MEGEAPTQASTPVGAVFLSYASQDAEAAKRICDALRAGGIEVWIDQSELRGGDAWDRQIRKQIHDCALFVPIISQHTRERLEGYFRREWRLAVERAGDMAESKAFLVPIVIDGTSERDPSVPERFRELQWSRLPDGQVPPAFIERVERLLSSVDPDALLTSRSTRGRMSASPRTTASTRPQLGTRRALRLAAAVVVLGALAYFAIDSHWISKYPASPPTSTGVVASATRATFSPPPHSIAVLPFVNMSGDKEQEYFSDGLSEELLNSLSRINELQVAARTSSFYFKGEHADLAAIAHKLNVATVLEGSVRRSGQKIRITAQLNNAVTGFHLWSETYDRDLGDVLKVQTEIADAVAGALKIKLLGGAAAKVELGGTRIPAAFDAYLRASEAYWVVQGEKDRQVIISSYSNAVDLDPAYAMAYAGRALMLVDFARYWVKGPAVGDYLNRARADARKAIALAGDLAEGHLALGLILEATLDFTDASQEYDRALALAPGNARVLVNYGVFASMIDRQPSGVSAAQRGVMLDPLNPWYRIWLGTALHRARRYGEAITTLADVNALAPDNPFLDSVASALQGFAYYSLGSFDKASVACEGAAGGYQRTFCLAITYDKLGRRADAEGLVAKWQASSGDTRAVFYSMIYAQWGAPSRALDWLDTAMRQRLPDLELVKTSALLDPLRKEPRFQAIERELKFPD
jgi:TolB-like protein